MRKFFSLTLTFASVTAISAIFISTTALGGTVEIRDHQLWMDGNPEPQLYGVEIQYFRLNGGSSRNAPREKVLDLWNKALEHAYEMRANAISLAIPWDFHEYAPGRFDFDGSVDEDGDGNADYPARDLKTFLDMVENYGFRRILVRPGPHIGTGWGFTGFTSIPEWFHNKYPDSYMQNAQGQRLSAFSYHHPALLTHLNLWFSALYNQVLKDYIGEGRPVSFVQLDEESLLTRQSLGSADFSENSKKAYRSFLRASYGTIAKLNQAHRRTWKSFEAVQPPGKPGANPAEDRDWYLHHEQGRTAYFQSLRRSWEGLGVQEPQVLFIAPEGHSSVSNSLLANYKTQAARPKTAFMSVNLQPKTYSTSRAATLQRPFKIDHDVKAADSASDHYLGSRQEWAIGTIQGETLSGDDHLTSQLSALAQGLKAVFIRHFHDGSNWKADWAKNKIMPLYKTLRESPRYRGISSERLSKDFWFELNREVATQVFADLDAKQVLFPRKIERSPLDAELNPRPAYTALKEVGEKLIETQGYLLGEATALEDPVCLILDPEARFATAKQSLDPSLINQEWSAGLIGLLMESSLNPRIVHWGLDSQNSLNSCRLMLVQDSGHGSKDLVTYLKRRIEEGAGVISFLDERLLRTLSTGNNCSTKTPTPFGNISSCRIGQGRLYHLASSFYAAFNSTFYSQLSDIAARRTIVSMAVSDLDLRPRLRIAAGNASSQQHAVAIGRKSVASDSLFVVVKNAGARAFRGHIKWADADLTQTYSVVRQIDDITFIYSGQQLRNEGFYGGVAPTSAEAFIITPTQLMPRQPE